MRQEFMLSCCCSVIFGQLIKQLQPRAERERGRSLPQCVVVALQFTARGHIHYTLIILVIAHRRMGERGEEERGMWLGCP